MTADKFVDFIYHLSLIPNSLGFPAQNLRHRHFIAFNRRNFQVKKTKMNRKTLYFPLLSAVFFVFCFIAFKKK